jgi:hypothetical protein
MVAKTGAQIIIPKECENDDNERVLMLKGTPDQIENVKREIALLTTTVTSVKHNSLFIFLNHNSKF